MAGLLRELGLGEDDDSAVGRAPEVMYQAWEARDPAARVRFAGKTLAITDQDRQRRKLPRALPADHGFGDEAEAILYAVDGAGPWRNTPGALEWLAAWA